MFFDHVDECLYFEGLRHELVAAGFLGVADVLLEGVGAEGDDGGVGRHFLDDAGGIETVHLGHADVHQHEVGVLVFVERHGFDTVVGAYQLVALLEHDLHEFVVAVLVLGHEDLLLVGLVGTAADADGAHVGGRGGLVVVDTADGALEGHGELEAGALADLGVAGDGAAEFLDDDLTERESESVAVLAVLGIARHVGLEDVLDVLGGYAGAGVNIDLPMGTVDANYDPTAASSDLSVNPHNIVAKKYYQLHLQMKKLRHKEVNYYLFVQGNLLRCLGGNLNVGHLKVELWSTDQHP